MDTHTPQIRQCAHFILYPCITFQHLIVSRASLSFEMQEQEITCNVCFEKQNVQNLSGIFFCSQADAFEFGCLVSLR